MLSRSFADPLKSVLLDPPLYLTMCTHFLPYCTLLSPPAPSPHTGSPYSTGAIITDPSRGSLVTSLLFDNSPGNSPNLGTYWPYRISTLLYFTLLCFALLYFTSHFILCHAIPHFTTSNRTIPHQTVLYRSTPYVKLHRIAVKCGALVVFRYVS